MEQKVKELRVQIDGLGQLTKGLRVQASLGKYNPNPFNSKECEKATDSLFLAKAWLGKVLGELGEDSPYPKDGTRKTVADIEPTADRDDSTSTSSKLGNISEGDNSDSSQYRRMNHIEKVDWLRQEISKIVKEIQPLWNIESLNTWGVAAIENCFTHISEARFWLGFELERIGKETVKG